MINYQFSNEIHNYRHGLHGTEGYMNLNPPQNERNDLLDKINVCILVT